MTIKAYRTVVDPWTVAEVRQVNGRSVRSMIGWVYVDYRSDAYVQISNIGFEVAVAAKVLTPISAEKDSATEPDRW